MGSQCAAAGVRLPNHPYCETRTSREGVGFRGGWKPELRVRGWVRSARCPVGTQEAARTLCLAAVKRHLPFVLVVLPVAIATIASSRTYADWPTGVYEHFRTGRHESLWRPSTPMLRGVRVRARRTPAGVRVVITNPTRGRRFVPSCLGRLSIRREVVSGSGSATPLDAYPHTTKCGFECGWLRMAPGDRWIFDVPSTEPADFPPQTRFRLGTDDGPSAVSNPF